ncbi:hypothetical protein BC832DRAFT_92948 [Gaertneriomyces semiglobifer]|nr:hypothetical protein BC832DRAFT_92948 [Gaertneriomyces semiglobifer]
MPRSKLGHGDRHYIQLEEIVPQVPELDEGEGDDITELAKDGKRNSHPTHPGFLGGLRRRLSTNTRPSTSNLLESVLMKSASHTPMHYFPFPSRAPSFSRLPLPWSSTGAPKDSREADMLCGLAIALSTYGAPLYRVEHRISQAAEDLNIPMSIFCLPSTLMVAIGDGSARHPARVQYLAISYSVNIRKLHDVDILARRVCKLYAKRRDATDSPEPIRKDASSARASVLSLVQQSVKMSPEGPEIPPATARTSMADIPASSSAAVDSDRPSEPASAPTADSLDDCLAELQSIVRTPNDYHVGLRILAGALQSFVVTVLLFKGSWGDGVAAMLLGALTSVFLYMSELFGFEGAVELLASMAVAALARFADALGFWAALSASGKGLCHEVVSLGGVCQLLPGTAITLGMLELGSQNPVAGSVRMFQAFIRALKLGYGLSTGSRLAIRVFEIFWTWNDSGTGACPAANTGIDYWRLPLWIPMNISIMINLRAHPSQWPHMTMTSLVGYVVSLIANRWFNFDITAGMAAFSIALTANFYARRTNKIAIGAVLSGIVWLVPGGIGVRGALAYLNKDAINGGTAFGIDMITRAMSIAVGLYMANVMAFPIIMDARARDSVRDQHMVV